MTEWISIKDRLPEVGDCVLVIYHPYDNKDNPAVYAVCSVNEYLEFYSDEADEFIEFATHWHKVPELPEG